MPLSSLPDRPNLHAQQKEKFMKRLVLSFSVPVLACLWFLPADCFCQSRNQPESLVTLDNLSTSIADLTQKVRPSVVQIRTVGFGAMEGQDVGWVAAQRGTGSGVILDRAGFIVTNAHVVKGAKHIEVWLNEISPQPNGGAGPAEKRSATATLVGLDPEADLAVIKIDRTGLVPLALADSDALRQGQIVLAFGNPMALENSVSLGVISSVERQLKPEDSAVYIQTDAPINPGNSGGPLVDAQGRLVGINTFILSQSGGSEGMGFAIPANVVNRIYAELRKAGHMHHGRIGILALSVTPSLAAGLQLPRDWGMILEDVEPGGPADRAGLKPGDMVMSADGATTRTLHQFLRTIDRHAIGEALKVTVQRGSDIVEAAVTVEERPDDPSRFLELVTENANLIPRLGILAIDINDQVLKMIAELRKPAGVVVAARVAGLPGSEEGLAPGDLIISFNGKAVPNIETLRALLGDMQSGSPVVLQIQRADQLRFIVLELP
jgi:serine protease Do